MGRIRLSLFLLAGLMALLSGCGERQTGANRPGLIILGDRMTVYSGAPLSGYLQDQGEALVNGERLALRDSHGMAGEWTIALGSLNSVQGSMNLPSEGQVASNARIAIQDATAVAYIGDYGSDSTQISLPLTNQGGILQVSTESGYSGLTSSRYAQPGEPERFYPSGRRTFARLAPNDQREASAQARLQRSRGCGETFAIVAPGSVGNSIRLELAAALATEKVGSGGTAVYDGSPAALREASSRAKASGADCVYYGAAGDATGAALLNRLIAADRSVKLFAGRASSTLQMTENLSASAQDALLVTTPAPSSSDLTAFGKSVARRYRAV
ncbi:MAG: hypothetical protein F2813_04340, partial [Actinobacteria bacterium]|nr:hypothetical protein [Actinomycetota bacterium]